MAKNVALLDGIINFKGNYINIASFSSNDSSKSSPISSTGRGYMVYKTGFYPVLDHFYFGYVYVDAPA